MSNFQPSGSEQLAASDPEPEPSRYGSNPSTDTDNLIRVPAERFQKSNTRPVRQETIQAVIKSVETLFELHSYGVDTFVYHEQLRLRHAKLGDILLRKYFETDKITTPHALALRKEEPDPREMSLLFRLPAAEDEEGHEIFHHEAFTIEKSAQHSKRLTRGTIDGDTDSEHVPDANDAEAVGLLARVMSLYK